MSAYASKTMASTLSHIQFHPYGAQGTVAIVKCKRAPLFRVLKGTNLRQTLASDWLSSKDIASHLLPLHCDSSSRILAPRRDSHALHTILKWATRFAVRALHVLSRSSAAIYGCHGVHDAKSAMPDAYTQMNP